MLDNQTWTSLPRHRQMPAFRATRGNKQSTSTIRRAQTIVTSCSRITQFMKKILGKGDETSAQKPGY
ncbi:hypothetical protein [Microcoleus sp. F10-C6]|uniref:hypothetical protein n=1 Tax=Microcoleus sp. F10-C6 TaxID=2818757 RepID=UPI002FD3B4AB